MNGQVGPDWLIDPSPFKASVVMEEEKHEISLQNGLAFRKLRVRPNAATLDFRNLVTGE